MIDDRVARPTPGDIGLMSRINVSSYPAYWQYCAIQAGTYMYAFPDRIESLIRNSGRRLSITSTGTRVLNLVLNLVVIMYVPVRSGERRARAIATCNTKTGVI
jgi:hypothetical protein